MTSSESKATAKKESSLFSVDAEEDTVFPTEAAFTVPVKIVRMKEYETTENESDDGDPQYGIVALERIPPNTLFWKWTHRVQKIHYNDLEDYLTHETASLPESQQWQAKRRLLRQGFVLPNDSQSQHHNMEEYFCSNPTDAGRFMNHSPKANCGPTGTLCEILPHQEMTMDYAFHGNPKWYQDICRKYNVLTERQVAQLYSDA